MGIWGELSSWRDEEGDTWLYVPIWGPVSKDAPHFPVTHGPNPHGSIMAFKLETSPSTHKPTLDSRLDFRLTLTFRNLSPSPTALSLRSRPARTRSKPPDRPSSYKGRKLLTDQQRSQNTHNAVLYALDAKTGKVLYQSGDAITSWVHFSGLAVADGRVYAVDHNSTLYCFGLAEH